MQVTNNNYCMALLFKSLCNSLNTAWARCSGGHRFGLLKEFFLSHARRTDYHTFHNNLHKR